MCNSLSYLQVDAYNVIPVWEASKKKEPRAYLMKAQIDKHLDEFLTEFPPVIKHPFKNPNPHCKIDWNEIYNFINVDTFVGPVEKFVPGTKAALENFKHFLDNKMKIYTEKRNDPTLE